jgi:coenzyme Q-binding protein COQ10
MPKFSVTREMPYKATELFAIAADVDSYKDFLPLVESSRTFDRERVADGIERFKGELRVRYKKLHIDETFVSDVLAEKPVIAVLHLRHVRLHGAQDQQCIRGAGARASQPRFVRWAWP